MYRLLSQDIWKARLAVRVIYDPRSIQAVLIPLPMRYLLFRGRYVLLLSQLIFHLSDGAQFYHQHLQTGRD